MWDEDPRWQEANYRWLVGSLKVAIALCAILSLLFQSWEPLLGLLGILAFGVGVLFLVWVAPMWLLGYSIELLAKGWARFRARKDLKHHHD